MSNSLQRNDNRSLGRFAQADSIIPPGVRGLDRYAYVNNSPMNYVDPSGHDPAGSCYDKGYCNEAKQTWRDISHKYGGGREMGDDFQTNPLVCSSRSCDPNVVTTLNDKKDCKGPLGIGNCGSPITPQYVSPVIRESSYCGGGANAIANTFDCLANVTQDAALFVDIPFAMLEVALMGTLCWGGLESCGGALSISHKIFAIPNIAEQSLSASSTIFSVFADGLEHRKFTESTTTAVATFVAGYFSKDPVVDFFIDGYGSMYNHGHAPDVTQIAKKVYSIYSSP